MVCACDVVNYLLGEADLAAFFAHANAALKPTAPLLFDISSRYYYQTELGSGTYAREREDAAYIMQTEYDPETGQTAMDVSFFVEQADQKYTRFEETHLLAAHQEKTIVEHLQKAGFKAVDVYGFGTKEPPKPQDTRIQFVAVKA